MDGLGSIISRSMDEYVWMVTEDRGVLEKRAVSCCGEMERGVFRENLDTKMKRDESVVCELRSCDHHE